MLAKNVKMGETQTRSHGSLVANILQEKVDNEAKCAVRAICTGHSIV